MSVSEKSLYTDAPGGRSGKSTCQQQTTASGLRQPAQVNQSQGPGKVGGHDLDVETRLDEVHHSGGDHEDRQQVS